MQEQNNSSTQKILHGKIEFTKVSKLSLGLIEETKTCLVKKIKCVEAQFIYSTIENR